MIWTNWPLNEHTGIIVRVVYDLKFTKGDRSNIPTGTKGIVLQQCWLPTKDSNKKLDEYEVYHVYFPSFGTVYVSTDDLDIVD